MEYLDGPPCQMDDLLDFSSDIGEVGDEDEDDVDHKTTKTLSLSSSFPFPSSTRGVVNTLSPFSGVVEEEELEWISNKDAFPMLESLVDIIPNQSLLATAAIATSNHRSPVSVLENSSTTSLNSSGSNTSTAGGGSGSGLLLNFAVSLKPPGRARSKCRRKRRKDLFFGGPQWQCWNQENRRATTTGKSVAAKQRRAGSGSGKPSSTLGRKCQHCQAEKTPQWRAGPMGPKTLCNACGVRYKSGRLVPEYRPAASPTFSTDLHSNSHRKIVEMRKRKHVAKENGLKLLESG